MSERKSWMPSDDELSDACTFVRGAVTPAIGIVRLRALIASAVEKATEGERQIRGEIIKEQIEKWHKVEKLCASVKVDHARELRRARLGAKIVAMDAVISRGDKYDALLVCEKYAMIYRNQLAALDREEGK